MPTPLFTVFREPGRATAGSSPAGGASQGLFWRVERQLAVRGEALPWISALEVSSAEDLPPRSAGWPLVGVRTELRYTHGAEKATLDARAADLGRAEALFGVLIPIRKSAAWWALPQDARREIFEERSRHIQGTIGYLPAIARRLYHSRDLGGPFDFLTWFEFDPAHAARFDELLAFLRRSEEWRYVEREVELRLSRAAVEPPNA
jgi:hypothetical protein